MKIGRCALGESCGQWQWGFTEHIAPYFHKGSTTGCLVIHGFTGTPANVSQVSDILAAEGYTVYAPLLSGHGTTLAQMNDQNEQIWLNDVRQAYSRLKDEGCTRMFLLGLSMGGLLASIIASELPCDGLVLMSAPFKMKRYLSVLGRLSNIVKFGVIDRVQKPYRGFEPYNQVYRGTAFGKLLDLKRLTIQASGCLPKIACPVLIMQSSHDNRVDLKSVTIAKESLKSDDVSVVWLENSPHGCSYAIEAPLVAKHCLTFVKRVDSMLDKAYTVEYH